MTAQRSFSAPLGVEAWRVICGELPFSQVLDIREADQFNRGHLPGAIHVPYRDVQIAALGRVDASQPLLVVDPGGARAAEMAVFLRGQGVQASYLEGGMAAWTSPLERPRRSRP